MACQHACKYCDGRAERYYVEGDYERDIIIRNNLPEILASELPKIKEIGTVTIGSGISDPYQPIESEEKIMRKCGQLLLETELSAAVLTKSSLILRDLDIWKGLHQKNGFLLMISITTLDDKIRQIFEPGASSVEERLKTIATFKENNIPVGALLMPFLPGITDKQEDIYQLIDRLNRMGIDFILPGGLTLRPGRQKAIYLDVIKEKYPHLMPMYSKMYGAEYPSGSPDYKFSNNLYEKVDMIMSKFRIPDRIPHFIFKDRFPLYDEVLILLHHMIHLYDKTNINTNPLKDALKRYDHWLTEERKSFMRKRKKESNLLDKKFFDIVTNDEVMSIVKNIKLSKFIKKIVIQRKLFDYNNLKLY